MITSVAQIISEKSENYVSFKIAKKSNAYAADDFYSRNCTFY